MPRPPFVNLFDIAGITMLTIVLSAIFALLAHLSHTSEYWEIPIVLVLLFIGMVWIAKNNVRWR